MDNSQPSLVAATATAPAQSIFDEIGRIRVIAAQDFDASDRLRDEGKAFVARIGQLTDQAEGYLNSFQQRSKLVEHAKLQAIGLANRLHNEVEIRKSNYNRLQSFIREKQLIMDRLTAEHGSLEELYRAQTQTIDFLSSK